MCVYNIYFILDLYINIHQRYFIENFILLLIYLTSILKKICILMFSSQGCVSYTKSARTIFFTMQGSLDLCSVTRIMSAFTWLKRQQRIASWLLSPSANGPVLCLGTALPDQVVCLQPFPGIEFLPRLLASSLHLNGIFQSPGIQLA